MLRFALSSTDTMHVGNMRVALINYIISRQRNEPFIVRIEETDKESTAEGRDQEILSLLKKFAIEQDQLFYQSDNLGRHQQFALSLIEQGKAFACICTSDDGLVHQAAYHCSGKCLHDQEGVAQRIKTESLSYVVRIQKPQKAIQYRDLIQGEIRTEPNDIGSFIILGTDGTPTHNFAAACDDMMTDISIVIQEETHNSDIAHQIHIKHTLGYHTDTQYAQLPSMYGTEDTKTGDHDESSTMKYLLESGFLPDAIINYLLLSGNKTPDKIFTLPDAIQWFDLTLLSKNPIPFDRDDLRLINREHLAAMDEKILSRIFGFADTDIGALLKLYLEEADTINELEQRLTAIFATKECTGEGSPEMKNISALIQKAPVFDDFNDFKQYLTEESGLEEEKLLNPLRRLMTGAKNGPKLSDIYPLVKPYITEIARCTS